MRWPRLLPPLSRTPCRPHSPFWGWVLGFTCPQWEKFNHFYPSEMTRFVSFFPSFDLSLVSSVSQRTSQNCCSVWGRLRVCWSTEWGEWPQSHKDTKKLLPDLKVLTLNFIIFFVGNTALWVCSKVWRPSCCRRCWPPPSCSFSMRRLPAAPFRSWDWDTTFTRNTSQHAGPLTDCSPHVVESGLCRSQSLIEEKKTYATNALI